MTEKTITTVTCHIWHEDENCTNMVDLSQYDDIEAAKEDAKAEALNGFSQDLTEPHRIWFTVTSFPLPVANETAVTHELPAEQPADLASSASS